MKACGFNLCIGDNVVSLIRIFAHGGFKKDKVRKLFLDVLTQFLFRHVGIGKAATSQPLDVSGNANVSGFLFASNVGIGTSVVSSALVVQLLRAMWRARESLLEMEVF